jgi:mannitol/fructose-specific phosphotransferase system IIA component (Ntr-type)
MIPVSPYLSRERIVDLQATDKAGALRELCDVAARAPEIGDGPAFLRAVLEREDIVSTGIGLGIAVPHAKIGSVKDFVLTLGRSKNGIEFHSLDGKPVHLVVLIAGPENRQARYLQILASVTLRLKNEELRRALLDAPDADACLTLLG